jgi:Enoyl-CoA hydratase/isomerase
VAGRGQGPANCASAAPDVSLFDVLGDVDEASALFAGLVSLAQRVAALPCPTVFAAHGLCLTWGFELALACDLILASERALFGLIEATVGLTPSMGGTQRLAERAGSGRARELVMSAERYDATTFIPSIVRCRLHVWLVRPLAKVKRAWALTSRRALVGVPTESPQVRVCRRWPPQKPHVQNGITRHKTARLLTWPC